MSQRIHLACPGCARLNRVPEDKLDGATCGACKAPLKAGPVHVDDAGLDRLLRSSPVPVLIDFYADWCGPCRMLAPHLETLAAAHRGELIIVKVDTERHQRHASQLGVQGIPALYLAKNGQIVDQAAGFRPAPALEQWVRPHLG
ncbi:MAG: thioredoxin [Deltaproteobacteria bacterium]|nr:MAG: thioredoxin [Deltaproteobacteria bacterium]